MNVPSQSFVGSIAIGHRMRVVMAFFAAIVLLNTSATAQVTWDANTGTSGPQDGSGTWSTSNANWWNGSSDVVWPNLTTSSAVIGANSGAAGTITVGETLTLNAITFNAPGSGTYTLTGGTLGFGGSAPTITANAGATGATIASSISGTGGLTKAGAGTLVLSGSNSFSGGLTLTGGQVQIANANALGTGTFTSNIDAAVTVIPFNLPTSGTVANAITILKPTVNRTYQFQQNQANNVTLAGNITVAAGNATRFQLATGVSSGTFTLTGSNSFGADPTTGPNVTLRFGGADSSGGFVWRPDSTASIVLLDGATFKSTIGNGIASVGMESSGTASMTGDFYVSTNNMIPTPAGAQLTFAQLRSTGTFSKTGAGTVILTSNFPTALTHNLLDGTLQVADFRAIAGNTAQWTAASYFVLNGGTLRYTGAAASTAKEFTLGPNGGGLDASGSGSAAFTSTSAVSFTGSGNRTLTLTGTNTGNNTLAMALNDNGSDTVSLSKTGAGTWVLSGSNRYTGPTTVSAGSLVAGGTSAFGAQSGNLAVSGGTLNLGGYRFTRTGTVSFTGGTTQSGTITNDTVAFDAQAGTVSASLAGAAGLTKTTSGTLTLSGSSTYTGMTTLSAGRLNINSSAAIGTGTFAISAGTLDNTSGSAVTLSTDNVQAWNGDFAFVGSSALNLGAGAVTLGADRTVTVTSSTLTVGGVVGGGFALTKAGAGMLSLTGSNTFTGATRITEGGLSIGNALALQNSTLDMNGTDSGMVSAIGQNSTLGGLTGSRNLDMLTRTLSIGNNNASTTYSGTLSNGALTKIGFGTLTLSASNAYAGRTAISAGALALSSAGNLASTGTVTITGSGATFDISGASAGRTIGMLTGTAGSVVTLGANSLTLGDATSGTFAGSIGGTGGLTKQGAGTLVLSGSNSFSGGVTLTAGQVQIANANALGAGTFATNVDVNTTIPFNLPTSGTIANNITINTPGSARWYYFQQNQSNNLTLAGNINVASGNINYFTLNGVSTGTITLTGSNTFGSDVYTTGSITFRIGGANAAGGTVWRPDVTTNLVLLDGASFRTTIGNAVASYGMETSGTASVTGDVNASAGTTVAISTPDGAQLTFSGVVRGGATYNKTGAGTWVMTNQFNEASTVNLLAGTLQVPLFSAIGSSAGASYLVLNGGTLQYTGAAASTAKQFTLGANGGSLDASGSGSAAFTSTSAVSFTGSGNRTLTLTGTNTGNNVLAAAINDSGSDKVSLSKTGGGTWVLSGSNGFTGDTTIGGGVLSFGSVHALANTTGVSIASGAGLLYSGSAASFGRNITVTSGTGTVTNAGSQTLTLGGTLTKNGTVLRLTGGSFNVTGQIVGSSSNSDLIVDAASVQLSNTNTYNGPTFVYNSGTLSLGINNAIPNTSAVTLGNATTRGSLVMGTNTDSISQLLFSGSGGTLSLSGDKTASPQLATNGSLTLGSNSSLVLTNAGTSAGLYRLISYTSLSGSFSPSNITGTPAGYSLLYTGSEIDLQQNAVFGTLSVTNPSAIITGGSAAFTYTVSNAALSGGATLSFSGSGSSNVAGSSSGSALAGGTSSAISGLVFTGATTGAGQTGTFSVTGAGTTQTGTVAVDVYGHAAGSTTGATIALADSIVGYTGSLAGLTSSTISNAAGYRVSLKTTGGTSAGFVNINNVSGVGAGSTGLVSAAASLDGTQTVGSNSLGQSFSLTYADDSALAGASNNLGSQSITVTGKVYDHATSSLASGLLTSTTISLGRYNYDTDTWESGGNSGSFSIYNLASLYGADLTADLSLVNVTGTANGFTTNLGSYADIAGGQSSLFSIFFNTAGLNSQTTKSTTFQIQMSDKTGWAGAIASNTLYVTANVIVVPEPGTLALAGMGIAGAAWAAARGRKRAAR